MRLASVVIVGVLFWLGLLRPAYGNDNFVVTWNTVALDAIRQNSSLPPVASRVLAILNVAIHDAVSSISDRYAAHAYAIASPPKPASLQAAVLAAAHVALTYTFPAQASIFDQRYNADLATLPNSVATTNGVYVGSTVARAVIADRNNDGSSANVSFLGSNDPGLWRPTPPRYLPAGLPQWANERPWCIQSAKQFHFATIDPPVLTEEDYIHDHNQIFSLGSATNSSRTEEQSQIAQFWFDGPATDTPPGHWAALAGAIASEHRYDIPDTARMFALLSMAVADAAIVAWDTKYLYGSWRPVTAIRDVNLTSRYPALLFDPSWSPLLETPNWPDFPSDRAMFGSAAAQLLTRLLNTNHYSFSLASDNVAIPPRSFSSFTSAATEQGQSRVFAGHHFNFSVMAGMDLGSQVGEWAFEHCLLPAAVTLPSSKTPTGVIVGGVFAAIAIVIFIVVFALLYMIFIRNKPRQVASNNFNESA